MTLGEKIHRGILGDLAGMINRVRRVNWFSFESDAEVNANSDLFHKSSVTLEADGTRVSAAGGIGMGMRRWREGVE